MTTSHRSDILDVPAVHVGEASYRRGYVHGATVIARMIEAGTPLDDVLKFISGPLTDWRFNKPHSRFDLPPEWSPDEQVVGS